MSMRISGQVDVVTGGGGGGAGIGRVTALAFAAEGLRVVVADFECQVGRQRLS